MSDKLLFENIYEEYRIKVLSYIRSKITNYQEAEDLCEDVFIKVYNKLDTYNESKSSISTWIYNICKNTVIDYFRSHKTEYELLDNYDYLEEENDEEFSEDDLQYLEKALKKLPEELKDLIVLHYYNDLNLKEVASRMNLSYGVAKLRHKKALDLLHEELKNYIPDV